MIQNIYAGFNRHDNNKADIDGVKDIKDIFVHPMPKYINHDNVADDHNVEKNGEKFIFEQIQQRIHDLVGEETFFDAFGL